MRFSSGVWGFDIFQVRPWLSGQQKACNTALQSGEDRDSRQRASLSTHVPQSALTVCLSSSRKAVRLGLPNSSCLVY